MSEQISYSFSEADETSTVGIQLCYLDKAAFDAVLNSRGPAKPKAELFAQMARFNALYMVARAGSGHLGSSFSSLDIVTWLYLNVLQPEDRYFSSKGHDSPGLYAVQTALGIIPFERIHALRRLGGLPGHPDVNTPGAHANTGSLGMGVSKAKGFLFADDLLGKPKGRVFVLTGDGELQEGQFWESLMSASRRRDGRLTVIVDHNKMQSDTYVSSVSDLGDLEAKFRAFGWDVHRCDGHDSSLMGSILNAPGSEGQSKAIIADTIKGRGVSFMEHLAMATDEEYYRYHSGAPNPDDYHKATEELLADINQRASRQGIEIPKAIGISVEPLKVPADSERMIPAYSEAIVAEARANPNLVALDGDLILDTGLIPFKEGFPDRFVECGIAEQDMVSQAGTMALAGLLPVVHSFACFLTSRASEQIYNNCTQGGKVIYVGSLAGLLPGGPGHSHQAVRDVTAMSAMPGMTIVEPASAKQLKEAFGWAANRSVFPVYLRITSIPFVAVSDHRNLGLPPVGQGVIVREGEAAILFVAGPVPLTEALKAVESLDPDESTMVVNMPWLNKIDIPWLRELLRKSNGPIITLESHYSEGGFGSFFANSLALAGLCDGRKVVSLGVNAVPVCGSYAEVLAEHGLDSTAILGTLKLALRNRRVGGE